MRECGNCIFWEPTEYGYGKCTGIKEKLQFELVVGYDGGYIKTIETESDFSCNQHQYLNE